jgi:hypothetical protein
MHPTGAKSHMSENSEDAQGATIVAAATAGDPGRVSAVVLGAALVAGLAAWSGGEACLNMIKPHVHAADSRGIVLKLTGRREIAVADAKNAGVAFALLGAALGTGLGLAGGVVRRSVRAAATAALLGLVAGAAASSLMSLALLPAFNTYKVRHPDEASRDLILPLLVHATIWSAAGAAGGWAFALGLGARGRRANIALGGLAGAALGAIVYELIGAAVFPAAQTTEFVSATWETRLLARLAVTLLAAVGVAMAATGV